MREILFRAKDPDTGIWHYGNYVALDDTTYCFAADYEMHPDNTKHYIVFDMVTDWGLPNRHMKADIDPNTLGQFTGLRDKNGKQIFEGDIVLIPAYMGGKHQTTVYFKGGKFAVDGSNYSFKDIPASKTEVIGNIYDNPELLEVST